MEYSLRQANKSNLDFIFNLKKSTLKEHIEQIWGWDDGYQQQILKDEFIAENNFMIYSEDVIIGVLEVNETIDTFHIVELEIVPEYQGKGIGSKILQDIILKMSDVGKKVRLGCFTINKKALKLYEKNGFRKYGETSTHTLLEI